VASSPATGCTFPTNTQQPNTQQPNHQQCSFPLHFEGTPLVRNMTSFLEAQNIRNYYRNPYQLAVQQDDVSLGGTRKHLVMDRSTCQS
jgi:hypothetical protein